MQEFCKSKEAAVVKRLEDTLANAEASKLSREEVEKVLGEILEGFAIRQPSDFFITHETDDVERIFFLYRCSGLQYPIRKRVLY